MYTDMKRKIYLDGELGEKYGRELTMNVGTVAEVFRCLEANYPGVKQYLLDAHERGIGFLCEVAGTPIETEAELIMEFPEGSFYISPQPVGSKSGPLKIIIGIALVALAFYAPLIFPGLQVAAGQAAGAGFTLAGTAGTAQLVVAMIGVNLALTGLSQVLAPDPSTDGPEQDDNYLFQGSGQTIVEGDPIPVLYGRLRIPGRPISFQVRNQYQEIRNVQDYGGNTDDTDTDPPVQQEEFEYLPTPGDDPTPTNPGGTPSNTGGNTSEGGGGGGTGGGAGGGPANKGTDQLNQKNHD